MSNQRPVFLDLRKIHFPLPAIVSILHRITGVALFVGAPVMVWLLWLSLYSAGGFNAAEYMLSTVLGRVLLWLYLAALWYHLCAGVKHLIMDMGFGESLSGARTLSMVALICALLLIVVTGMWLL